VPLGFTNDIMGVSQTLPATERRVLWSFAGLKRAARLDMFRNFKHLEPYKCYLFDSQTQEPWLDRAAFRSSLSVRTMPYGQHNTRELSDLRISGNGMHSNCRAAQMDAYYDRLMPGHPLPSFSSWRKARHLIIERRFVAAAHEK
jgi:hypothetical protein